MIGYVIIFSLLGGFIIAIYLVLKCLPFVFDQLTITSQTQARAAKAEGQIEMYRDMVAALGTQNAGFTYAVIDLLKETAKQTQPLPYQLIQPQNGTYTNTHAPTHEHEPQNNDQKGSYDNVRLILRKGVLELGNYRWNVDSIKLLHVNGGTYEIPLPQKGDKIAKFEGLNLYAACCDNCNNRYITKDPKTKFCQDTCKDSFHNNSKY